MDTALRIIKTDGDYRNVPPLNMPQSIRAVANSANLRRIYEGFGYQFPSEVK